MSLTGEINARVGRPSCPGASTQIIYNSKGVEAASANLTFNAANNTLNIGGNLIVGGTAVLNSAPHTYGTISMSGATGGYSGIQFTSAYGTQGRTLMVSDTAAIQGFYDSNASAWDWYFNAGVLTVGTVPAAQVTAGSFGSGNFTVTGTLTATTLNATSDETRKTNIIKINDAQNIIASLNGVRFNWKDSGNASAGLIAQDVEKVMPELVTTADDGSKSLNYNGIIGALVEEMKALRAEIEALKAR